MRLKVILPLFGLFPVLAMLHAQENPVPQGAEFVVEDFLNRNWVNELVSFPLSKAQEQSAKAGKELRDTDGRTIPYQLSGDTGTPRIYFSANVVPFGKSAYHFSEDAAEKRKTDLQVTETNEWIEVTNDQTGVRIRKQLQGADGPIAGIRLPNGSWTGGSSLANGGGGEYRAEVVASGPVFVDVNCRMNSGEKSWQIRFRVQSGEPIVLVDESFNLGGNAQWRLVFSGDAFRPNHLLHRLGWMAPANRGTIQSSPIAVDTGKPIFAVVAWVPWWTAYSKWVGIYPESGSTLLVVGARDGEVWKEPKSKGPADWLPLFQNGADTFAALTLKEGKRNWLFGVLDKAKCLAVLDEKNEKGLQRPDVLPLPQQAVIKHEFPLERVKDYVFEWKGVGPHPRLYLTPADVQALRENPPEEFLKKPKGKPLLSNLDAFLAYNFAMADPEMARLLAEWALAEVQTTVDLFVRQPLNQNSLGMAPHHAYSQFVPSMNLADAALAGDALTPDERRRMLAQLAFLGYTITREDYWSPERGYNNHPNMTSFAAGMQASIGYLLNSHPLGGQWASKGMTELVNERDRWSDANGGWLEAPHYAMATYDTMVSAFLMAKNSGSDADIFHPKMKNIARWFASISTPPDSRLNGWRHLPPLGNTWLFELTGEFGALAGIWKDRDPEFASELKWLHQSQGEFPAPGVGGSFPMRWGYDWILREKAKSITPKPPSLGSELFPETTVVLRSHFPSDRETLMTLIAGKHRGHYDKDSGSFTVWGKGRIVADDFGYYSQAPALEHNLVTSPFSTDAEVMNIEGFVPADAFDYVRGKKGGWTRQITFVKDADPLGPNYFVIADSFAVPGPATWRMWTPSQSVKIEGKTALIVGKEDVDTDVVFTEPSDLKITTEEKTMENSGLMPEEKSPQKVRFGRVKFSQTAIVVEATRTRAIMSVIYPRLKTDPLPVVTGIAEGKGAKIVTPAGTDYVFMAPKEFSFEAEGVRFNGTSGAIRIRKEGVNLSLGAAGKIGLQNDELKGEGPTEKKFAASSDLKK